MTSVDAAREAGHGERADFGIVWLGQGISSVGTAVTSLALPLVAITTLHASGWQVAMLTTATYAPSAILALPAGVWLDRRSRRPVVLLADLGRGVALATIPIAAALGKLTVTQLLLVALVVGAFSVFFDVAYQSWLPSVVPRDRLLRANGLLGATNAAGRLSGPGLGGALVSIIGGARTLWIDAGSFAIAAAATSLVRARETALTVSSIKAPLSRELTTGLVWLREARPCATWSPPRVG